MRSSLWAVSSTSEATGSNETLDDSDILETLTASLSLSFFPFFETFFFVFFNGFRSELCDLDLDLDFDLDFFFLRLVTFLWASVSLTGSFSEHDEFLEEEGGLCSKIKH